MALVRKRRLVVQVYAFMHVLSYMSMFMVQGQPLIQTPVRQATHNVKCVSWKKIHIA